MYRVKDKDISKADRKCFIAHKDIVLVFVTDGTRNIGNPELEAGQAWEQAEKQYNFSAVHPKPKADAAAAKMTIPGRGAVG